MRVTEPFTIFLRTLPSGKKVYYYQFRDEEGHRSAARSCGTSSKSEAARICRRLYREGKFKTTSELTFGTFASDFFDEGSPFLEWKKAIKAELAPATVDAYRKILRNQILPFFQGIKIRKITISVVKEWILNLRGKCSAKTSNNAQSVLNIILKAAKEKGIIESVPSLGLSARKVEKKERQLLTAEEIGVIYRSNVWTTESARRAFLVCAITGMRIGEVTGLRREDVGEDRLNVRHSYTVKYGLGETKTKKSRFVPIPRELKLRESCGSVWCFQKPKKEEPIAPQTIYRAFLRGCEAKGIDRTGRGLTIHTLRNFFISYMRGSSFGAAIDSKVKAVVGHADESQTDWYTYWTPEMFPEIYEVQRELYRTITGEAGEKNEKDSDN